MMHQAKNRYWAFLTEKKTLRFPARIENSRVFADVAFRKKLISALYFLMFVIPVAAPVIGLPDKINNLLGVFALTVPFIFILGIFVSWLRGQKPARAIAGILPIICTVAILGLSVVLGSGMNVASPLLFALLTLIAAAFLDIGLALAVWFLLNMVIGPQTSIGVAQTSAWLGSSESSLLLFSLSGGLGTLPFFVYVRKLRQERETRVEPQALALRSALGSLGIAFLVILASVFISLASARAVAQEFPIIISDMMAYSKLMPINVLVDEIGRTFDKEVPHAKNRNLARVLVENAARTHQNLYVFEKGTSGSLPQDTEPYRLIIAARRQSFSPQSDASPQVRIVRDLTSLRAAERRALEGWLRRKSRHASESYFQDKLQGSVGGSPVSAALDDRSLDASALKKDRFGDPLYVFASPKRVTSNYLLVATSAEDRWWEAQFPADAFMFSGFNKVFPLLFAATLFLVFLALLIFRKRQELRRKLIQAEERARINQESHDRISNRLSALAIAAETQAVRQAQAQEFFGQLPGTLRRIVSDLKEVTSKSPGNAAIPAAMFGSMLREACKNRAAEHNFDLLQNIRIDDSLVIEFSVGEALILCLEEALGNVAKHAGARNVEVSVMCPKIGDCRMTVKDDGQGFAQPQDFSLLEAAGHSGLAGMTRRVNELGGALMVESQPGKGTTVTISWR